MFILAWILCTAVWGHKPHALFQSSTFWFLALRFPFFLFFSFPPVIQSLSVTEKCLWAKLKLWLRLSSPLSPSPNVFFSDLPSLCQSQIGQPLTSPADPPNNLLPLSPARLNQSASLLCCSVLYTLQCAVGWWQAIWDLPTAALLVSSSAAFHGSKRQSLLPLIPFLPFPPFGLTHSTILLLPYLPMLQSFLLILPSLIL